MQPLYDDPIVLHKDEPLQVWMVWFMDHVPANEDMVYVNYEPKDKCTVAKNDLVNKQYTLSDGRLIKYNHISPSFPGGRSSYFISCEPIDKKQSVYRVAIEFFVKADSKEEATEIILRDCGVSLGTVTIGTADDQVVDYEVGMKPDEAIIDVELQRK